MTSDYEFAFHIPKGPPPENLGQAAPDFSQGFLIALRTLNRNLPAHSDLRAREKYDRQLNELYQTIEQFLAALESLGQQALLTVGREPVTAETVARLPDRPGLFEIPKILEPDRSYSINYSGFHDVFSGSRSDHIPPLSLSTRQLFIGYLPDERLDYSGYAISARQFSQIVQAGGHLSVDA